MAIEKESTCFEQAVNQANESSDYLIEKMKERQ